MRRLLPAVPFVVGLLMAACSHIRPTIEGDRVRDTWENPSNRAYYRVRGLGTPPDVLKGSTRRRAASRDAALAGARRELLALIGGVRLAGGLTVQDGMAMDSQLKESVDRLVIGAEEALVEFTSSDHCVVTLQIPRSEVDRLGKGVQPKDMPKPLPEPARAFWKTESRKENTSPPWTRADTATRPRAQLPMPIGVTIVGLMVPGWAQMAAASDERLDSDGQAALMMRGLGVMGGTLGLLAVAGDNLPQKKAQSHGTAQSTNRNDNRTLAYAALGGAVLLHGLGIYDAYRMLNGSRVTVSVVPDKHGARVMLGKRF